MAVAGFVAPGFEPVRHVFERRYANKVEKYGATLSAYHKGVKVVSLWCGHRDSKRQQLYQEDTLANVFSATKGMSALCLAILVGQGKVKYNDKVAEHWPEFAANGKANMTIGQMASHQGGLCACREDVTIEDFMVEGRIAEKLAAQEPWWTPGEKSGYHAQTSGFLIGELIKRKTGQTLGEFFRDHVAEPFAVDFHIGLPEEHESRVADIAFIVPKGSGYDGGMSFLKSDLQQRCFEPNPYGVINSRQWRAAQLGSINGQTNAHALARIYGGLANDCCLDGRAIVDPAALREATAVQRPGEADFVMDIPMDWRMGFMGNPSPPGVPMLGPEPQAFGHAGFGGHVGFADPVRKLGVGYVRNGNVIALHLMEHMELVDAIYACVSAAESKL